MNSKGQLMKLHLWYVELCMLSLDADFDRLRLWHILDRARKVMQYGLLH